MFFVDVDTRFSMMAHWLQFQQLVADMLNIALININYTLRGVVENFSLSLCYVICR